ncbi:MAG TPA: exosortase-associated EpsI family protein, partial [Steroidobacter sp.]|nr:exosortase-associated EpsI family protein [Steroidobacter sp.]
YASQRQGKELIGYRNSILGTSTAKIIAHKRIAPQGPATELLLVSESGEESVLWYFYRVGAMQTNRDYVAQTWYAASSLASAPLSSIVALRTACAGDCGAARAALHEFIQAAHL